MQNSSPTYAPGNPVLTNSNKNFANLSLGQYSVPRVQELTTLSLKANVIDCNSQANAVHINNSINSNNGVGNLENGNNGVSGVVSGNAPPIPEPDYSLSESDGEDENSILVARNTKLNEKIALIDVNENNNNNRYVKGRAIKH